MKAVITSTLALLLSSAIVPAVHAQDSRAADQQLAGNVRSAAARNGVSLSHVFVFSRSGVITMVGWVPEHDQVALAERSATSVDGVTSVNNWLARGR